MSENWIFWRRSLEVRSPLDAGEAARRLTALFAAATRFSAAERLAGRLDGADLVVSRRAPLAGASDVVEYRARLEPEGRGCVLRGTLAWKMATRIQFIGFPLTGLLIAGTGFLQRLYGNATADAVTLFGGGIFAVAMLWLMAANGMKHEQIEFIEAKLGELLA